MTGWYYTVWLPSGKPVPRSGDHPAIAAESLRVSDAVDRSQPHPHERFVRRHGVYESAIRSLLNRVRVGSSQWATPAAQPLKYEGAVSALK